MEILTPLNSQFDFSVSRDLKGYLYLHPQIVVVAFVSKRIRIPGSQSIPKKPQPIIKLDLKLMGFNIDEVRKYQIRLCIVR